MINIKKIRISAGSSMLLSYIFGQGTYFVVLAGLMFFNEKQMSGWLAYKMAIVSFAFQMADVGAPNVLLRAHRDGNQYRSTALLNARSSISLFACLAVAILALTAKQTIADQIFLLVLPLVGAVMGLSKVYLLEATGAYSIFAVIQITQWVFTLLLGILDYKLEFSNGLIMYVPALILHCVMTAFLNRKLKGQDSGNVPYKLSPAFHEMSAVASSVMLGQIWARVVVVQIFSMFGPAVTVSFTLARGILTGLLMFVNSWLRFAFTSSRSHKLKDISQIEIFPVKVVLLSSAIALLIVFLKFVLIPVIFPYIELNSSAVRYFDLLWILPIWIIYLPLMLQWGYVVSGWRLIVSDIVTSIPMAVVFYLMLDFGPVLAVVASDICKACALLFIVWATKKIKFMKEIR